MCKSVINELLSGKKQEEVANILNSQVCLLNFKYLDRGYSPVFSIPKHFNQFVKSMGDSSNELTSQKEASKKLNVSIASIKRAPLEFELYSLKDKG